jgi:hypothetical protein
MKIVLKLLFILLWSLAIKLCFIFSKKISQIAINGFLQKNVWDPRSQDTDALEL